MAPLVLRVSKETRAKKAGMVTVDRRVSRDLLETLVHVESPAPAVVASLASKAHKVSKDPRARMVLLVLVLVVLQETWALQVNRANPVQLDRRVTTVLLVHRDLMVRMPPKLTAVIPVQLVMTANVVRSVTKVFQEWRATSAIQVLRVTRVTLVNAVLWAKQVWWATQVW